MAMTNRERFLATIKFEKPDRPFRLETLGFWNETLARWKGEGLPAMAANMLTSYLYFGMDPLIPVYLGADQHPGFDPLFSEKIIEKDARRIVKRDITGTVIEVFTDGSSSVPGYLEFPVKDWDSWEDVKKRLDPNSPNRLGPQWDAIIKLAETTQSPLSVSIPGVFGTHRHLLGFEPLMEAYYDKPELVHAISKHWVYLWKDVLAKVRKRAPQIDSVMLWEDMCGKNGPVISPAMFREFMSPYYKELVSFVRDDLEVPARGVDTDGNMTLLIPLFVDAGINWLWPFEVQAGMDVNEVRAQWPREFAIWGGIDKRALAKDEKAIRDEVERVVPQMLEKGGYIPGLDHSVPPDVPLSNFRYYLELVRKIGENIPG